MRYIKNHQKKDRADMIRQEMQHATEYYIKELENEKRFLKKAVQEYTTALEQEKIRLLQKNLEREE